MVAGMTYIGIDSDIRVSRQLKLLHYLELLTEQSIYQSLICSSFSHSGHMGNPQLDAAEVAKQSAFLSPVFP